MKAAFLVDKESVEVREVSEPELSEATDILVRMEAFSVCLTDFEIIGGKMQTKKRPIILGHEGSGTVISKRSGATNVEVGDRVLIDPNICDLTCPPCLKGFRNLCMNGGLMGRDTDGVFRERLVVPSRYAYLIPKKIPPSVSPLIQPLSTVVHALKRIEIGPGDTVLILGLGVPGLMFTQLAKLKGARVIAASGIPQRLDLGNSLGADTLINRSESDLVTAVIDATQGRGVDFLIDTIGSQALLQKKGIEMVAPHGTILLYAAIDRDMEMNSFEAYLNEITFKTTRSSLPQDFYEAIRLVELGQIDLSYQTPRSFAFNQLSEAIFFFENRVEVLKSVMTMT